MNNAAAAQVFEDISLNERARLRAESPAPLICRCGPVGPAVFASWPAGYHWRDEVEGLIESRTCPGCSCTLSVPVLR